MKYIPDKIPLGTEIAVLLGLVTVVLGSFLIVEFPYVFANVAETSLSKFGVATYSEYVKRGFFEFLLVSVIVYGVLWAGLGALRAVSSQQITVRKILIFLQSILFITIEKFLLNLTQKGIMIWTYPLCPHCLVIRV